MLVSLFTDASHNHITMRAGWGAWARSERGIVYNGGGCFHRCPDSAEAELEAILEGIQMVLRSNIALLGDSILIQTDNVRAAAMMPIWRPKSKSLHVRGKIPKPRNEREIELMVMLNEISNRYELEIIGRHVKGHSTDGSARTYVNNLCDRLAGKGRRKADAQSLCKSSTFVEPLIYTPDNLRKFG